MISARARSLLAALFAAVFALAVGAAGAALADPSTTPAPETSAPATSDPPATVPESEPDFDDELEIKAGTPKMGEIQWDEFGGDDSGAAKDLPSFVEQIVGYAMTGFGIAAVVGGLCVCLLMIAGFRGRSSLAQRAAEQTIWLWVAVMLVGSVSSIAGLLLSSAL